MKRFVAVSLGLLIGLAIWVAPSQAHAVLVRSSPAANSSLADPPTAIEIWFSEPLEETYTDLRVVNAAGDDVGAGNSIVDASNVTHLSLALDSLEPGIYTVIWQTLSQVDGHVWSGYFPFTVLNEDGSSPPGGAVGSISSRGELPTPVEAAIRWLTLVGGMLLLGVALFRWLVAPPSKDGNDQDVDADTPALWLLYLAFFLLFVGDWAQIWQQVIRLGDAGQLFDLLLGTRVARLVLARQLLTSTTLLVLLTLPQPRPLRNRERPAFFGIAVYSAGLILLLWLGREQGSSSLIILVFLAVGLAMSVVGWLSRPGEKQGVSYAWIGAVISAVAALFTLALSSHAGGVPGSNWAILSDYIHLLAAAAWLGGLALLVLLLWRERLADDDQVGVRRMKWIRRYSFLASFAVLVLVLTGLFNSLAEIPSLEGLWTTTYGRVLLVKLLLVGLTLLVAFVNNLVVHRRAGRWSAAEQTRRLKRQTAVELGTAALLVISVALLSQTPPPRGLAEQQLARSQSTYSNTIKANDLTIQAQITPNQIGNNRFWLRLYYPTGGDIGEVQLARLLFNHQDGELGQAAVDLEPLGENTFAIEGAYLNQAGTWEVSAYVRRRGMDDVLGSFDVEVPESATVRVARDPWQNPLPAVPVPVMLGILVAVLGVIPLLWQEPLGLPGRRAWPFARAGAMIVIAAGLLIVAVTVLGPVVANESGQGLLARTNPIKPSVASIEQGRALYEQYCLECHGPTGQGDGPTGLTLSPPPVSLQVKMAPGLHSDGEIFDWISNGVPGTSMPAFGDTLTEDERWHLINYIHRLVPEE